MKIYLAGSIFGAADEQAKRWRELATKEFTAFGIEVADPLARDYRGQEWGNEREIVEGDIAEIKTCTHIMAMCLACSWGTAMELRIAKELGIPVFAVVNYSHPMSPWLRYHCTRMFTTANEAMLALRNLKAVANVHPEKFDGNGYLLPEFQDPPRYTGRR